MLLNRDCQASTVLLLLVVVPRTGRHTSKTGYQEVAETGITTSRLWQDVAEDISGRLQKAGTCELKVGLAKKSLSRQPHAEADPGRNG
mmetsp:Transcript_111315/g.204173  ORF Transcript_111315/g.204173 Transcript_111315/m.204173 type:complete len:88 (-) Transcript_111315:26-289(-)